MENKKYRYLNLAASACGTLACAWLGLMAANVAWVAGEGVSLEQLAKLIDPSEIHLLGGFLSLAHTLFAAAWAAVSVFLFVFSARFLLDSSLFETTHQPTE